MTAANPAKRFRKLGSKAVPYLLILPVVIYYILFWIRPVLRTLIDSFRTTAGAFTFQNYIMVFTAPWVPEVLLTFNDLAGQYAALQGEIDAAVARVLAGGPGWRARLGWTAPGIPGDDRALAAYDAAVKAADVTLFRIHVAMAIGGKGFLMLTGEVSDVEAAIEAGAREIARRGLLVGKVVIPRPEERLYRDVI